jgi:hypothetical protein
MERTQLVNAGEPHLYAGLARPAEDEPTDPDDLATVAQGEIGEDPRSLPVPQQESSCDSRL